MPIVAKGVEFIPENGGVGERHGAVNRTVEVGSRDAGNADGGFDLVLGETGIRAGLALGRKVVALLFSMIAARIERLQQFPAPPHRPRLDTDAQLAERVIIGLPSIRRDLASARVCLPMSASLVTVGGAGPSTA